MSKLFDYRDEHNDPGSASDAAEETEGRNVNRHVEPSVEPEPHFRQPLIRSTTHNLSATSMLYLGTLLYVGTLLINALAVLNEERFLARSPYSNCSFDTSLTNSYSRLGFHAGASRCSSV